MEQDSNKIEIHHEMHHEDTKKLTIVIVLLSLFVVALFGLAPHI